MSGHATKQEALITESGRSSVLPFDVEKGA